MKWSCGYPGGKRSSVPLPWREGDLLEQSFERPLPAQSLWVSSVGLYFAARGNDEVSIWPNYSQREKKNNNKIFRPRLWRSRLKRLPRMWKIGCSNPSSDRPKLLKQVVTAPLLNARQQVWVPRILGDDHYRRIIPCHTVSVARYKMAMSVEHRPKSAALHW